MPTIVTRETGVTSKDAPLTNAEVDANFINLNNAINTLSKLSQPSGQLIVALGDSLQGNAVGMGSYGFTTYSKSGLNWGCALLKQAIWMPVGITPAYTSGPPDLINYCLAVSGATSQDVIDNQIPLAQALKASWWSVQCGTNDLTLLAGSTVAQVTARLQTICETGLLSGLKIALWTIVPRNDAQWTAFESSITSAGSTIAKQKLKQMAINNWIRRYAQETPNIVLIDPYEELVNPASSTGNWLAAYSSDGVHWNNTGAFVAGQIFASAMRPFIKPINVSSVSQLDIYNATDNVTGDFAINKGMQGSVSASGLGMSGTWPTNWTVDNDGTADCVATTQARSDTLSAGVPANGRELEIAISSVIGNSTIRAYQASTGAIIPANTPFYAEIEISVISNSAAWRGPWIQLFSNEGSAVYAASMETDSNLPLGALFDAVIRTPVMISTGVTGGLIITYLSCITSSNVTVKIKRVSIRAINVNLPGLIMSV